jgi:ABC-2 type transport system permease protein
MLNYVRAELYKASRRRVLYVMVGLLLAGECLFCLGWVFGWPDGKFEDMVALLTSTMILGMYLVIPLTWLTAPDTRRGDTLKNEVSYGLSRPMIYMGKMCAALTVCLLTCGIVFAFYLGSNWVLCTHGDPAAEREMLAVLGYVVLCALPLWLGMLGVCMLAFTVLRSAVTAVVVLFLGLNLGPLLPPLFRAVQLPAFQQLGRMGERISLVGPFWGVLTDAMDWAFLGRCWLLGLGWLAVSTAVGLLFFQRQEL